MIRKLINWGVSRLRGKSFHLDDDIPLMYLLGVVAEKVVARFYGMFRLRTLKAVYVAPSATIKSPSKLKLGRGGNLHWQRMLH